MMIYRFKYYSVLITLLIFIAGCSEYNGKGLSLDMFEDKSTQELVASLLKDDYKKAKALIEAGADINAQGKEGISPLFYLMASDNMRDLETIEFMLKSGADPNYQETNDGITPLFFALQRGKLDALELLIKYGGDVNKTDYADDSLLMEAAFTEDKLHNIVFLLNLGADLNYVKRNKSLPSTLMGLGKHDIALQMLELGFDGQLNHLARSLESGYVNKRVQPYKERFIEELKKRGVVFPVMESMKNFIRNSPNLTEAEIEGLIYGRYAPNNIRNPSEGVMKLSNH